MGAILPEILEAQVENCHLSPECMFGKILLDWNKYNNSDMWSAGCVLAELLTNPENGGKFLRGGRDYYCGARIRDMVRLMGIPPDFPQEARDALNSLGILPFNNTRQPVHFEVLPRFDPRKDFTSEDRELYSMGIDLMKRLLIYDPAVRLTAKQALEHPFFKEIHSQVLNEYVLPDSFPLSANSINQNTTVQEFGQHIDEVRIFFDKCKFYEICAVYRRVAMVIITSRRVAECFGGIWSFEDSFHMLFHEKL
jgi:serine/threonine protein kinase